MTTRKSHARNLDNQPDLLASVAGGCCPPKAPPPPVVYQVAQPVYYTPVLYTTPVPVAFVAAPAPATSWSVSAKF